MKHVVLYIDDQAISVPQGATVAAAVAHATARFRRSTSGAPRAAVCGMGVCFECRVRIDAAEQQRACMIPARDGMRVTTVSGVAARD
jgi:sarcosine oxidase subunit alpha